MSRLTVVRLACAVISVVAGVVIADFFPVRTGQWNWTASAAAILIWVILFLAFCRRK